jgi:hypothetical protein
MNGLMTLAARYIFRRFRRATRPTSQHTPKCTPQNGVHPIMSPSPIAIDSRPRVSPSVRNAWIARWNRDARDSARELPPDGTVVIFGYYDGSARVPGCGVAVQ